MSIKQRIHNNFSSMGDFIYLHPKLVLILAFLVALLCCASLGNLRIDTSNESNLDKSHPEVIMNKEFHELYGFEEAAILMVKTDDVFDRAFLSRLAHFHEQLEANVTHLDRIKSIINSSLIYGEDDELMVEDLQTSFPEDDEAAERYRERVMANELFRDSFIAESGEYTALFLYQTAFSPELLNGERQPFTSQEQHVFMEDIRAIIAEFEADNFQITVGGGPMIGDTLLTKIATETPVFAGLSNLIIIILLYTLFRRVSAVLLPLLVVNISLASLFGLMAFFDVALSSFSQILPSFILTVGVCDSVHFISIFYQQYEQHQDKRRAIKEALAHTGMPMMLTSLTTATGMLSFAFTEIVPIRALGIFAAAGVIIAWFYTIVLLPALISISNINPASRGTGMLAKSQRLLTACGELGWNKPWRVISIFAIALVLAIISVSQLRFEHDPVKWLPAESELPVSIDLVNREMSGALAVEVMIDTGRPNGVKSTAFIEKLDEINQFATTYEFDGVQLQSSRSIADTLKQVHLGLNNNDPAYFKVPENDELVAQEILLFEMSGGSDLETQVTQDFSQARITMLGPWRDLITYSEFLERFEVEIRERLGDMGEAAFTGVVYLLSPIQKLAIETLTGSYISAAFVITLMMILMIGSLRLGLLSMIPNLLPIVLGMGLMYITGMPLDLYSILIGSIAIGLVVDDTVHFLHNFQRVHKATGDAELAIRETLNTTGNALLFTTILLFGGFVSYCFSGLINLQDFGTITATIVAFALIADIVLLPALLRVVYAR